jgi:hypothetical protein
MRCVAERTGLETVRCRPVYACAFINQQVAVADGTRKATERHLTDKNTDNL